MPKFFPIAIEPDIEAAQSDLLEFHWNISAIRATFMIPQRPDHALEVSFADQCIVRLVDEMPLSTEVDDSSNEGAVSNHFAYRVEGALFFRAQSEAFKTVVKLRHGSCKHYRFVTGWTCLDVVTGAEPCFTVVPRAKNSN